MSDGDTILGDGGADTAVAGGADTTVAAGADTVTGGAGADTVAAGADTEAGADTTAGSGDDTKAGDGKDEIPENYTLSDLPEGVVADEKLLGEFTPIAKELGLSQEKFDKLTGWYAKSVVAQQAATWTQLQTDYLAQAKADPELKGLSVSVAEGVKGGVDAAGVLFGRALDHFYPHADPAEKARGSALRQVIQAHGLGNHPEMVRFMARVGKAVGEDTFVTGREKAKGGDDAATILYG